MINFKIILDQSLAFILKNYTKKFSITTYGNIGWYWLSGFEQVINNGVATYFAVDYGSSASSRIVIFNQHWVYKRYHNLPYNYTYTTKYVGGYFYFTSNDYFYKTDLSFNLIAHSNIKDAYYRQCAYDPKNSKFYVSARSLNRIDVYDTSCSLLHSINLAAEIPHAIAFFNENIYVGLWYSIEILVLKNDLVTNNITISECTSSIFSITMDQFGYMAISCLSNYLITVYDSNGISKNTGISTSNPSHITSIDSSGRFVIMAGNSLDIYF